MNEQQQTRLAIKIVGYFAVAILLLFAILATLELTLNIIQATDAINDGFVALAVIFFGLSALIIWGVNRKPKAKRLTEAEWREINK